MFITAAARSSGIGEKTAPDEGAVRFATSTSKGPGLTRGRSQFARTWWSIGADDRVNGNDDNRDAGRDQATPIAVALLSSFRKR